jgi:hypothetical protein
MLKERVQFRDLVIDRKVIIKWIFKKWAQQWAVESDRKTALGVILAALLKAALWCGVNWNCRGVTKRSVSL